MNRIADHMADMASEVTWQYVSRAKSLGHKNVHVAFAGATASVVDLDDRRTLVRITATYMMDEISIDVQSRIGHVPDLLKTE